MTLILSCTTRLSFHWEDNCVSERSSAGNMDTISPMVSASQCEPDYCSPTVWLRTASTRCVWAGSLVMMGFRFFVWNVVYKYEVIVLCVQLDELYTWLNCVLLRLLHFPATLCVSTPLLTVNQSAFLSGLMILILRVFVIKQRSISTANATVTIIQHCLSQMHQ